MNQQDVFSISQLLPFHPILKEEPAAQMQYFLYLKKCISILKWSKRRYTCAQLDFYRDVLCGQEKIRALRRKAPFAPRFCFLIPFDLAIMTGFRSRLLDSERLAAILARMFSDFQLDPPEVFFLNSCFEAAFGRKAAWKTVLHSKQGQAFEEYVRKAKENADFLNMAPYHILTTATMSAGKSTLINALSGKNISRTQNMACTGKIHTIIAKPFEDGIVSEDDYELHIHATQDDLMDDHADNKSGKILVSTYFNGSLGGRRIILFDSPGVNSSDNPEHTRISQHILKSRKYQLLLYVLNATQLSTTDEELYLRMVRQKMGDAQILFVLNKTDALLTEEENVCASIQRQEKFLQGIGFKEPVICPLSSRAAYLVRKGRTSELSRREQRELELLTDEFQADPVSGYYEQRLGAAPLSGVEQGDDLLVNSGFLYFEKMIEQRIRKEQSK